MIIDYHPTSLRTEFKKKLLVFKSLKKVLKPSQHAHEYCERCTVNTVDNLKIFVILLSFHRELIKANNDNIINRLTAASIIIATYCSS